MVVWRMVPLLVLIVGAMGTIAVPEAQTPALPRVYVSTKPSGDKQDLRDRQESVSDLKSALRGKKKSLSVVEEEKQADIVVDVVERTTTVPRVRIGLGSPGGPGRAAHLKVMLTRSEKEPVPFTNTTAVLESSGGWRAAANDIAKQIEKWILDHRNDLGSRFR